METINLIVRIMPMGDELDLELPILSTGKEIIDELLNHNVAPRADTNGNPYIYELISKSRNAKIEDHKTLYDIGISNNELIFMVPKVWAGSN